jgi:isoleucyl-tRNA synthetase
MLGTDSRKMSKHLGNYPQLDPTFDSLGADAVRFYLLGSSLFSGETAAFDEKALLEAQRNVVQRLGNVQSFFAMYATVDGWKPPKTIVEPQSENVLDQWMLARLNQAIEAVTRSADNYDTPRLAKELAELLDDVSNWFVRRSRRRFWKSEDDGDKASAYATLHYVLLRTCQIFAPWTPFISDRIWRELTQGMEVQPSVHLSDWPAARVIEQKPLDEMASVREAIALGLAKRAEAKIKVRQPLASVSVPQLPEIYNDIIADELNVKKVIFGSKTVELDTQLTDELKAEGMMRDIVRQVQNLRKAANLNVDDRIMLNIKSDDAVVKRAVTEFGDIIRQETLAVELADQPQEHETSVKVESAVVVISLGKVQ